MTNVLGAGVCDACGKMMRFVDGCTDEGYAFVIDGDVQYLSAVPYGDDREGWPKLDCDPPARCHDCACLVGEFHHLHCDMAVCPNCERQQLSCECEMPEPDDPRLD